MTCRTDKAIGGQEAEEVWRSVDGERAEQWRQPTNHRGRPARLLGDGYDRGKVKLLYSN